MIDLVFTIIGWLHILVWIIGVGAVVLAGIVAMIPKVHAAWWQEAEQHYD